MYKFMIVLIVGTLINTVIANGQTINTTTTAKVDSVIAKPASEKANKAATKKAEKEAFKKQLTTAKDTLTARKGLVASLKLQIAAKEDTIKGIEDGYRQPGMNTPLAEARLVLKGHKKDLTTLRTALNKANSSLAKAENELKKVKSGKGKYTPNYPNPTGSKPNAPVVASSTPPADSLKKAPNDSVSASLGNTTVGTLGANTMTSPQGKISEATGVATFDPGTKGVGRVVNLTTEPNAIALDGQKVTDIISKASRQAPWGASMKLDIDTAMTPGVYQVDGMKTLAGVRGPDTQYLIHYISKATKAITWALAEKDPSLGLAAIYAPGATNSFLVYTQGDNDEEEEIVVLK